MSANTIPDGAMRARSMSITPLEPRQAGDLKGFGFTVTFNEHPSAASSRAEQTGEAEPPLASSPVTNLTHEEAQ